MRSTVYLLTALLTTNAVPAGAQVDACPAPIVAISNQADGDDITGALVRGQEPAGASGVLGERALNRIIDANRGDIRFAQGIQGAADADFSLTMNETGEGGRRTTTLRLSDQKGRTVIAPPGVDFTAEQLMGSSLDALAERLIGPASPLLPIIRAYQRRVREEEQSAIYAILRVTPASAVIAPDEEQRIELELVDCDEGNPPLPDRPVTLEVSGVGGVAPTAVTTDADGKASVVFTSSDRGTAEVVPVWAYENTAGLPTVADADPASIRVAPGFGISALSVNPGHQPFSSDWFLGYLWVLSDDQIELDYPEGGVPTAREAPSPVCQSRTMLREGGVSVPTGGRRRWDPERTSGGQRARSVIEVTFDSALSARTQVTVETHGEPEAAWDEEGGSEVEATAAFDLIVDIENPDEQNYVVTVTPRTVRGSSSGAAEFTISLFGSATGCRRGYALPLTETLFGSEGATEDRSGRALRVRVEGDPHVEVVIRIVATAGAHGGKMEPPFDGDAKVEVDLQVTVEPVPGG